MLRCRYNDVLAAVGGAGAPRRDAWVTGVATDSRGVQPGDVFFALEGARADGHAHVPEAVARGAVACVVRRGFAHEAVPPEALCGVDDPRAALGVLAAWVRRRLTCRVLAITGSMGKTTTKDILAALLAGAYVVEKAPESFNNAIGVPLTVFRADARTSALVAEVGANHAGEIAGLCSILQPSDGMIVSIAPVHLDGFGSLDGVIRAKGELAAAVPSGGTLYLQAGMRGLERFRRLARCRTVICGEGAGAPEIVALEEGGVRFRIPACGELFLRDAAPAHVAAASAAVCAALDWGVAPADVRERLAAFCMPRLRWQKVAAGGATLILDCYNANPEAVRAAVRGAEQLRGGGRLIAVLGDMRELGAASARYHRELGEFLAETSAAAVLLFGEEVAAAYEALRASGAGFDTALFRDAEALAQAVAQRVAPGDTVLFKASRGLRLEAVAERVKALLGAGARAGVEAREARV
ncbi:MAG TPA: UDP-N-acetylmuramoyl-tripeptide--D-alanyl-D-alanine ligase [Planctomycetota bacterium]|nr:UDP-N-acetylmuramoyl-tripeptide--D-alanyl-D-alanine ligase [Planctomycetota bacterium]OQC20989.1 MAG: UDP-N-acetylmuramoyl-tripeptide--D-alanyl-D-alanine ligase [Planctomycetes bacterium ADurb.Bin069]HNR98483.1 UDP-N-acetylmuramoyl-tripeptide--D-alanyl-D-alanine ligase [Planctomycetota bacterium]HNU25097.1 UDP-N-acetylmuramoyl-tripeptide--D-alanyl-D-alanine ligase [Planctomycetota bacterium]HOE30085.1 UDP-N-acetylmuramoyl-tripeptide--D-alanyl-D-alanine ligase [Planctomycetota bacterium]